MREGLEFTFQKQRNELRIEEEEIVVMVPDYGRGRNDVEQASDGVSWAVCEYREGQGRLGAKKRREKA